MDNRIKKQLAFSLEIDKVKNIFRQTSLSGYGRKENDAEHRATRREEMTKLLRAHGCSKVEWKFPDETGFYQPIVVARKA